MDLLRSITRLAGIAVPYRRRSRDLVTVHLRGWSASGRKTGRRSWILVTRWERERDVESEGEIAWKETENGREKRIWGSRLRSEPKRDVAARTGRVVRACHEMPMCEPGVTKTSQDHLSVSGPSCGGTPSVDGGLNKGQLIAGSPVTIPTGLPRLTDCSGNRRIEVLKRQG